MQSAQEGGDVIITDLKILSQISRPTSYKEVQELELESKLIRASKTAWIKGAGLAAIQIGFPLRFAWYIHNNKCHTLLNPEIINKWGEDMRDEGCLSIPNFWKSVTRAWTIEYLSGGKKRKISGFEARLIQHEIDHMNGITIKNSEAK